MTLIWWCFATAVFIALIKISNLIHSRLSHDGNWRPYGDTMRRYSNGKLEYRAVTDREKEAETFPDAW